MNRMKKFWLMKSEPDELSIHDLKIKKRWHWDGVRNYEARNFMRDHMQIGDLVIFYHSNATSSGPAGVAKVASLPYPDFTQFDTDSKYFDSKASMEKPRWFMVDVAYVRSFSHTITREEMKQVRKLEHMQLWTRPRLSITPLTKEEFDTIVSIADRL